VDCVDSLNLKLSDHKIALQQGKSGKREATNNIRIPVAKILDPPLTMMMRDDDQKLI